MINYEKTTPTGGLKGPKAPKEFVEPPTDGMKRPGAAVVAEGSLSGFGKWSLDEDGLLIITGKGAMPYWKYAVRVPWYRHRRKIKKVSLSDGITCIGNCAFFECDHLTRIDIPSSIIEIGYSAFFECDSLTQIDIPRSVTHIGGEAFRYCKNLAKVDIPASVTHIGEFAFWDCKNLTWIDLPASVTSLGKNVFFCCDSLRKVTMPARFDRLFFKSYYGISKDIVTFY